MFNIVMYIEVAKKTNTHMKYRIRNTLFYFNINFAISDIIKCKYCSKKIVKQLLFFK